jgi:transposase
MGLIAMSERDLQRIEVLSKVTEGLTTIVSAAHILALSTRQVRRLLDVFEDDGAAAIRHKSRERPSNNRISNGVRDYVLTLVRERYLDFGPTLAAEKLAQNHSVAISRETLRKWMTEAGIWGYRASSAVRFISLACDARPMASWCRLMARITAGLRSATIPALYSSSLMMRQVN